MFATNAKTCKGYVNNYDKNCYLEKISKAAVFLIFIYFPLGFKSGICLLIAPVPVHCFSITIITSIIFMKIFCYILIVL